VGARRHEAHQSHPRGVWPFRYFRRHEPSVPGFDHERCPSKLGGVASITGGSGCRWAWTGCGAAWLAAGSGSVHAAQGRHSSESNVL